MRAVSTIKSNLWKSLVKSCLETLNKFTRVFACTWLVLRNFVAVSLNLCYWTLLCYSTLHALIIVRWLMILTSLVIRSLLGGIDELWLFWTLVWFNSNRETVSRQSILEAEQVYFQTRERKKIFDNYNYCPSRRMLVVTDQSMKW